MSHSGYWLFSGHFCRKANQKSVNGLEADDDLCKSTSLILTFDIYAIYNQLLLIRHLHFYTFQKLYLTSKMNSKSFVTVLLVTFMIGAMMVEIAEAGCDSNGCCNCSRYIYSRHNVIILRNRVIPYAWYYYASSKPDFIIFFRQSSGECAAVGTDACDGTNQCTCTEWFGMCYGMCGGKSLWG